MKTINRINSTINADQVKTFGESSIKFKLDENNKPCFEIKIGEISIARTEKGMEQERKWDEEDYTRFMEIIQKGMSFLNYLWQFLPQGAKVFREEVDKMDSWDDQRSEARAKRHGMAYISKAKLDQLIQEVNELRAAQEEEKTAKDKNKDEFENVR
jgi:hypothetical protein